MSLLGPQTWPEIAASAPLLVVPLGSLEQHGPHLPLDTDTRIASAVAAAVAARVDAVVAPVLAYGASGEHAAFPGTLSLGTTVLAAAVLEIVRSADHFGGVVLINAHGGNSAAARGAVERSRAEGRRVLLVGCGVPNGDPHAGHVETSLLLHLAPEVVHVDRAEPGDLRPWAEMRHQVLTAGVAAVSSNGVLGDPRGATAAAGAALFAGICDRICEQIESQLAEWTHG